MKTGSRTGILAIREYYNVEYSVWCALTWLYDEDTAKLLKYQYWGPAL